MWPQCAQLWDCGADRSAWSVVRIDFDWTDVTACEPWWMSHRFCGFHPYEVFPFVASSYLVPFPWVCSKGVCLFGKLIPLEHSWKAQSWLSWPDGHNLGSAHYFLILSLGSKFALLPSVDGWYEEEWYTDTWTNCRYLVGRCWLFVCKPTTHFDESTVIGTLASIRPDNHSLTRPFVLDHSR